MRYTGPDYKRSRRLGFSTLETGQELKKRSYGPGQHGNDRKKKPSEYGKQLVEKQKLAQMYGVNERQFRRLFVIARASEEVTGIAFFRILESRLDNLVYRMGFARTRRAARQLVNHGHITVDGKKVDIPSYRLQPGQVVALKETSKNLSVVKEALEAVTSRPEYVTYDENKVAGTFVRMPERNEFLPEINEQLIVEFYKR